MGDMTLRDWVRVATQSKGNKRGLSLEKYCDSMLNPNTWGDEFIIRAFSFMESFSVYIYEYGACGFRKRSTGGDFTVAAEKGKEGLKDVECHRCNGLGKRTCQMNMQ